MLSLVSCRIAENVVLDCGQRQDGQKNEDNSLSSIDRIMIEMNDTIV
jgi:hypothetical protein